MLNLSITDPIDGFDKIGDLRNAVGTEYGYGSYVTKLISVSEDGNTCVIEEQGNRKRQASWLTWNRFFY